MYAILVIIHVIVSIFLIMVILLQAGRGSGLSDSFGSSQMQNLFGTKSTSVLTRLTTICAIGFLFTCLSLALLSSRSSKSLVDRINIPRTSAPLESNMPQSSVPQSSIPQPQTPVSQSQPVQPNENATANPVEQAPVTTPQANPQGEMQGGADTGK